MKLTHLRYFEHLASVLNYTKAAKDLYIAQPTLSTAIKRMEQEVGFPLFRRSEGVASTVELTEQGEILSEYVSQALEAYDEGLRLAQESHSLSRNTLRLGTVYSMKGAFWSQAIDSFLRTCETLPRIHMEQAYSSELVRQLKRGEIDVAFSAMTDEASGLDCTMVWSQPLVVCVNRESPLAQLDTISLDKLQGRRLLTYGLSSSVSASLNAFLKTCPYELDLVRQFDDEIALASFASSNPENVSLLAYSFLVNAFENVVCLPVADADKDFHKIYLMSRREQHAPLIADFIEFMTDYSFPDIFAGSREGQIAPTHRAE